MAFRPIRRRLPGKWVLNFLHGGAAANVFAEAVGASVRVVDAGVSGGPHRPSRSPAPPHRGGNAELPYRTRDDGNATGRCHSGGSRFDGGLSGGRPVFRRNGHWQHVGCGARRPQGSGTAARRSDRARYGSGRCRSGTQARRSGASRGADGSGTEPRGGTRRVRRFRDRDDDGRHARRRTLRPPGSCRRPSFPPRRPCWHWGWSRRSSET